MSVQAQLADGRVLEFPDGTDPAVVQATVKRLLASGKPMGLGQSLARESGILTRGAGEFIGSTLDAIANTPATVGNILDFPGRALAESMGQGKQKAPFATYNTFEQGASDLADKIGLPNADYPSERIGTAVERGLGDAALMLTGAGEASALAKAGSTTQKVAEAMTTAPGLQLASGAAAGGASRATAEAGGGPLAQTAAGLAAGLSPFAAEGALTGIARGTRAVSRPFAAAASEQAAERQAGERLASRATDASSAADALASDGQSVEGSLPTTFQQSGDMGLGALEREVATKNPELFTQRRADQNAARVESLQNLQAGADPNDVAKSLKAQFDELEAATQAHVDQRVSEAQERLTAAGGVHAPEETGAALRQVANDARNEAKVAEGALYQAIDPDGTMTANVGRTSQGARDIASEIAPTARPMEGEEAAVFEAAQAMPPLAPLRDLVALKTRITDAMREELSTNGQSQPYRRLTMLRGAIEDNLSNSIAHEVARDDSAVARGVIPEEESIGAVIRGWVSNHKQQKIQAGRAVGDGVTGFADRGAARDAGAYRAAGEAGGQFGDSQGSASLPAAPTVGPEVAGQLKAANAATKARAETFDRGPVGEITKKAGSADAFKLPDGRVAGKFFHPGPTGNSDMESLFKAVPRETSLPIIEDYAATTLRREAMDPATGTLDPRKFEGWKKRYADSLRSLPPETQAKFADAANAGQAVSEAMASRTVALKDAQSGAIGKVMNLTSPEDVTRTVGQILTGSQPAKGMMELARATANDPAARAGLRQAVADFIQRSLVGNTEAGTSGVSLIKADRFQTFAKTAKPALRLIFSTEEVDNIEAIAADIQRAKRSENAVRLPGGSNTAQDTVGRGVGASAVRTVLDTLAAGLGGFLGPLGAGAGVISSELAQAARRVGINRVDDLVTQAMLHPSIARRLLAKVPPKGLPAASRSLAGAITAAQISSFSALSKKDAQ